ncbi:hypothetical protein [Telluribacter sp.]|jgi:L-alanine-DL-glutamate epimerase-like enolase superfamily enzyme|uniref:hypothetical protein n=1 Tax=Telluribacter sp. TaxID=1978767 RepID=UPI002E102289|nr:hypothetical protein [Telluribacter sp.]
MLSRKKFLQSTLGLTVLAGRWPGTPQSEDTYDLPNLLAAIKVTNGKITIPDRVGLGIEYDDTIWKSAQKMV